MPYVKELDYDRHRMIQLRFFLILAPAPPPTINLRLTPKNIPSINAK